MRANVATQRVLLTAISHMGTIGTIYNDPGPDYVTRLNPRKAKDRAVHQTRSHGLYRHPPSRRQNRAVPATRVNPLVRSQRERMRLRRSRHQVRMMTCA
jgi:hypothetical protein